MIEMQKKVHSDNQLVYPATYFELSFILQVIYDIHTYGTLFLQLTIL